MLFFYVRSLSPRISRIRVNYRKTQKHYSNDARRYGQKYVDKIGNLDAPVYDQNSLLQPPFWVPGIVYRCKRHYVQRGEEVGTHVHRFVQDRAQAVPRGDEGGGGRDRRRLMARAQSIWQT